MKFWRYFEKLKNRTILGQFGRDVFCLSRGPDWQA
jgi:hypothetical protein